MAATLRRSVQLVQKAKYAIKQCYSQTVKTRSFFTTSTALAERRYTEKHEWITVDGKIGTVGISDYAQDKLGDIVYVQLPDVGSEFQQDDECGALESVKAASEIYCPVSGTVKEVNKEAEQKPALINSSCYDKGWLFKLELSKSTEVDELMNEDSYKSYLEGQDE